MERVGKEVALLVEWSVSQERRRVGGCVDNERMGRIRRDGVVGLY